MSYSKELRKNAMFLFIKSQGSHPSTFQLAKNNFRITFYTCVKASFLINFVYTQVVRHTAKNDL